MRLGQVWTTAAAAAGSQAKLNSGSRPGSVAAHSYCGLHGDPTAGQNSRHVRERVRDTGGPRRLARRPRRRRRRRTAPKPRPATASANHRSSIFCASVSQGLTGTRGADAPATTVTSLRPQALSIVLTRPAPASGVSHAPEVVDTTAKRRSVAASALRATRSSNPASVSTHNGRLAVMLLVTAIVRLLRSLRIHLCCQEQSQSITRLRRRSRRWSGEHSIHSTQEHSQRLRCRCSDDAAQKTAAQQQFTMELHTCLAPPGVESKNELVLETY